MIARLAAVFALAALFVAGCAGPRRREAPRPPCDLDAERRAVVAGVLVQHFRDSGMQRLVLHPAGVPRDLAVGRSITWFADADWDAMLATARIPKDDLQAAWAAFHARFPDGLAWIRLGAVELADGGDEAVLDIERTSGSVGGEGERVTLRRTRGRWRVVRVEPLWMS